MYRWTEKLRTDFVNRLEFLGHGKNGLDVVITELLNQMGDGGVVLSNKPGIKQKHFRNFFKVNARGFITVLNIEHT